MQRMTHSMINIRSKQSLEGESEGANVASFAEPILITGPSPTARNTSTEEQFGRLVNFARQKHHQVGLTS